VNSRRRLTGNPSDRIARLAIFYKPPRTPRLAAPSATVQTAEALWRAFNY